MLNSLPLDELSSFSGQSVSSLKGYSSSKLEEMIDSMRKKKQKMKTLNVTVICKAVYSSEIEVPEDLTLEEAIEYAKQHMDEINVGEMGWISDDEIDEDNCDFGEE